MTKRGRGQRRENANTNSVAVADTASTPATKGCVEKKGHAAVDHLDLFTPLLQYYVALATTVDNGYAIPANDDDDNAQLCNDTAANGDRMKNDVATDARQQLASFPPPHRRYEVLQAFVIPNTVSAYLRRVPLLQLPSSASADDVGGDDDHDGSNKKRHRVESSAHHHGSNTNNNNNNSKGSLEDVLASIRGAADARLPPFANDAEFIAAHEGRYVWKDWASYTSSMVCGNGQLERVVLMAKLDLYWQCRPCQSAAAELFTEHIAMRLQKMRLSPRVVRVAQKLSLVQHELEALTYLLVCHCGSVWPLSCAGSGALTPAALAHHNGLSPFQLMHFLADYREHMKQGMLLSDIKYKCSFMDCRLAIPQEVIAALSGDRLSEEQLIKLEKTALAEILVAERTPEAGNAGGASVVDGKTGSPRSNNPEHRRGADDDMASNDSSDCSTSVLDALGLEAVLLQAGDEVVTENVVAERMQGMPPNRSHPSHEQQQSHAKDGRNGSVASSTSCAVAAAATKVEAAANAIATHSIHTPYESDIEYMDESFKLLANVVRLRGAESDMKDEDEAMFTPKNKVEATMRELRGKVRVATAVHHARTAATMKEGKFLPRIEALSQKLQLSDLEKRIMLLLVGNVVSHDILIAINGRYVMREGQRVLTVGYILFVLCDTLRERVAARKSFYQSGPLLSNGVLSLSLDGGGRTCFNTDLMDYVVDIDRKIVDHLMGTDTETAEMVPGSRLYTPTVPMANVVLPHSVTDLVLTTIQHYSMFEECKRSCGFGEGLGASTSGLVFLFYGPSGTGKTMLANAVAYELHKRILLVNLLQFKSDVKAPEMLRFILREAKLNDAMVFFDECESIFESRESNPLVTSILAEFEKYDGLIVLATNKAQVIDEAMNRRISLMVEFRLPDQQMREKIWRAHLPRHLALHDDVSLTSLALNYELSGGLIRNATIAALSKAVARENTTAPTLRMQDLEEGARLQLRGFFLAAEKPAGASTESYFTPKRPLSELVVEPQTRQELDAVVRLAKGRSTLFSQWGFSEDDCADQGALYLFQGPSGTGKSLAAEGIAYECGAAIRLCNVAELLLVEGLKVHDVFGEARKLGAIVLFDEAQVLFNHSEQSVHVAKLIHYHAMRYPRPVIFIATTGTADAMSVDARATPLLFQQQIHFRMPTRQLRRELWRRALPEKMPRDEEGIDLDELSEAQVSAKLIRAAAFSACCRVAMLGTENRRLTMRMLREELENMQLRESHRRPRSLMFA
ncbi:AAA ATPase [Trypanosoma grayi]|uniref:AAA ATPase n=1 Tax=Trypanosoma grayi TaxID=71804 RepID=UPI0004F40C4C|nr:AAA ATPase [Trypanosoma grayi]KEG11353.1 AAA ATPase [Trypanosoma grayi]